MAAPSSVTIDIQRNVAGGGPGPYTYGEHPNQVSLTKEEDPPGSGFSKFKHTSATGPSGGLFNVKEVKYGHGGSDITDIKHEEPIKSLSVWYYSRDTNHNQPLLIEIGKDGTFKYHETKGNATQWNTLDNRPQPLKDEDLEQELDYLNCQYHKLVTINLTDDISKEYARSQKPYCCYKHDSDQGKVTVTSGKVASQIPYVKHFIDNGTELSGIKYYPDGGYTDRKNITATTGLRFPLPNVKAVYAFYCTGDGPSLICIKEESHQTVKWFKQSTGDTWESVINISTDPENIKNCSDGNFDKLVKILREAGRCLGYKTCAESTQSSPLSKGPGPAPPEKAPEPAGPGDCASGGKANGVSETPSSETTLTTSTLLLPTSMAGYFFATSAGSGLTTFLGYKF